MGNGTCIKLCGVAAVVAACMPAHAAGAAQAREDVLEEIVVTAQKREQGIQDVGIAMSAYSGEQLFERGVTSTDALTGIPGVYVSTFNSQTTTTLTIRGVNQNDFADHNEPPNAVYADGAYVSFVGGAGFSMFDVDRLEVLRGPQGTLFGRNATGGLLHVITRRPSEQLDGYAKLSLGEHDLLNGEAAVGGPLSGRVSARLSGMVNRSDGYVRNTLGGRLQGSDTHAGRLQLQFRPTDSASLLLNVHGSRDKVDGSIAYDRRRAIRDLSDPAGLVFEPASQAAYAQFCNGLFDANTPAPLVLTATSSCSGAEDPDPRNPRVTAVDEPGHMSRKTWGSTLTGEFELAGGVSLTSVSDYLKLDRVSTEDTDGTQFHLFHFFGDVTGKQFSQELRMQGRNGPLQWVAGLYFLDIDHRLRTGIDSVPDNFTLDNANPDVLFPFLTENAILQNTRSWAAFAQGEYEISPNWTGIVGLRWSEDRKRIDIYPTCSGDIFDFTCGIIAPPGSVQGDGFNRQTDPVLSRQKSGDYSGKAQLNYRPDEDWLLYAGVTRGQKGGGFNAAAIAGIPVSAVRFDPEVLVSYEAGFKSTLGGGSAIVNGTVFRYDYSNYQAFTLTGLTPTVFNVDANVSGAELEVRLMPVRGLEIAASGSHLRAIAKDVPSNLLPGSVNLGDQRIPQAPRWSWSGSARYEWAAFGGKLAAGASIDHTGARYFNTVNHPALRDGAYSLVNATVSFASSDGNWDVSLWGRNLGNTRFASIGFDMSGTDGTVVTTVNPPRWFGATLSYRF